MENYYRITFDFSFDDDEDVEEIFGTLLGMFTSYLDPHEDGAEECTREWYMDGVNVSDEYKELLEAVEGAVVGKLRDDLVGHEGKTVEEFFETLEFKDYPPESEG